MCLFYCLRVCLWRVVLCGVLSVVCCRLFVVDRCFYVSCMFCRDCCVMCSVCSSWLVVQRSYGCGVCYECVDFCMMCCYLLVVCCLLCVCVLMYVMRCACVFVVDNCVVGYYVLCVACCVLFYVVALLFLLCSSNKYPACYAHSNIWKHSVDFVREGRTPTSALANETAMCFKS